jgi:hypothetical protein
MRRHSSLIKSRVNGDDFFRAENMSLKIYDVVVYEIVVYDIIQWTIVVAIVLVSALYMLGKIAPQWRVQLAQRLQQPRYSSWVNQIGSRLGAGCDTCGSCATRKSSDKK